MVREKSRSHENYRHKEMILCTWDNYLVCTRQLFYAHKEKKIKSFFQGFKGAVEMRYTVERKIFFSFNNVWYGWKGQTSEQRGFMDRSLYTLITSKSSGDHCPWSVTLTWWTVVRRLLLRLHFYCAATWSVIVCTSLARVTPQTLCFPVRGGNLCLSDGFI